MPRVLRFFSGLYFSLPVQLVVSQIVHHRLILLFWLFFFLVVTNNLFVQLGGPNLFYEPTYLNTYSGTSMFLLGLGVGFFTLSYHLTAFILDGYRFLFLYRLRRPFRLFVLNNSLIPLLFTLTYGWNFVRFQRINEGEGWAHIAWMFLCFIIGQASVIGLVVTYFYFTGRNRLDLLSEQVVKNLQNTREMVRRIQLGEGLSPRVDIFLTRPWRTRRVLRYSGNLRSIYRLMNKNHGNALLVEGLFLLVLVLLGLFQNTPAFQVPAASSVLILFAFVLMLVGASAFWFRRIGLLVFVLIIGGFIFLNSFQPFIGRHHALGLDYTKPVAYTLETLDSLAAPDALVEDYRAGVNRLEAWKAAWQAQHGQDNKPYLMVVTTSGGGVRSATWTLTCLLALDSLLQHDLRQNISLITGASGGMMGAAYWRELAWLRQQGQLDSLNYNIRLTAQEQADSIAFSPYQHLIARDLLNRILFYSVANTFYPKASVEFAGRRYFSDRGYAFEAQLTDNLGGLFTQRQLGDYREPVAKAELPMMLFSPAIIKDGRQLLFSSQGVSNLAAPQRFNPHFSSEIPAIDGRRLFAGNAADQLRMASVIRMNASFPYVLPFVELPTNPLIEVMDAGVIDNYGVNLAVRYLYNYRNWIQQNTRGVIVLQLRDTRRVQRISQGGPPSWLNRMLSVFGGTYNSIAESKDFSNDELLIYARRFLEVPVEALDLQYIPNPTFRGASLNFYLTRQEKRDVMSSIYNQHNQQTLAYLVQLLRPQAATDTTLTTRLP